MPENSNLHEKLELLNTKLDELALQRRLDTEAEHLKRITCTKFIRLFGSFSGSSFKINTRVLNEVGAEEKTQFWDLVKRVCICLNTNFATAEKEAEDLATGGTGGDITDNETSTDQNPLIQIFEWTKNSKTCGFIAPINEPCKKLQLLVKLANQRNIYRLSPALSHFFNRFTDTKYNVIKDIYKYVNTHKLYDYASSNITCDSGLEDVFRIKSFNFRDIQGILEPHFQPIFYCVIDVNIDQALETPDKSNDAFATAGENENGVRTCENIWDIELETDDLSQMPTLFPKNVQLLEKKIEDTKVLKRKILDRIELLKEFRSEPAHFINRKMALDSESMGVKSIFYDDLNVQTALFELIKKKEQ